MKKDWCVWEQYEAYSNAYDAKDQALTSKYENNTQIDAEVGLMKKDEAAANPQLNRNSFGKVASENTTPQTKPEQKEVKAETMLKR